MCITFQIKIIQYAKQSLNKELNENIYLTLTDHINFAVARYKQGMNFNNALLSETIGENLIKII